MNDKTHRDVNDLLTEIEHIREDIQKMPIEDNSNITVSNILHSEKPTTPTMTIASDKIGELQKKIEELTQHNNTLQEELVTLQMKESQLRSSGKPIGTDELRMEFLNFTSAHIQQFNTRIKKTEEMIANHIQNSKSDQGKQQQGVYPKWLLWLNLGAIFLFVIFLVANLFVGKNQSTENVITTAAPITTEAATVTQEVKSTTAPNVEKNVTKKEIAPVNNSSTISKNTNTQLPFQNVQATAKNTVASVPTPVSANSTTPEKVNKQKIATPIVKEVPKGITPVVKQNVTANNNTKATNSNGVNNNTKVNEVRASNNNEAIVNTNKSYDNKTRNTALPKQATSINNSPTEKTGLVSKSVASINNTQNNTNNNTQPKNTEKKAATNAPVYFGED